MPNKNYTHIIFLLDRSGSMFDCVDDTIGGVNALVKAHSEGDGKCTMTLVQFDNEVESLYSFASIDTVVERTTENYTPRGGTALLDAIGKTVLEEGRKLSALEESERPGLVILAVLTDGRENASSEFTKDSIAEMIKHQEEKYSWEITYLSADSNAFNDARKFGFNPSKVAKFDKSMLEGTYDSLISNTTLARTSLSNGLVADISYSARQRKDMVEK